MNRRKYVSDTKAGRAIAAWIVLSPAGNVVGKINAHYGDSGTVTVDVWDWDPNREGSPDHVIFQQGRAGGYGYDKLTAALSGLAICGHTFTYHGHGDGPAGLYGLEAKGYKVVQAI